MLTVWIRSAVLFLAAVTVIRLMDKRQIGQLQPYELVTAILIAELAATPMGDIGIPLLYGILPMLALLMLHAVMSIVSVKSERIRKWLSGKPSVVVRNGRIDEDELQKICCDLSDLLSQLRSAGFLNPAEVGTAILETSGKISVFPKASARGVTTEDLGLETGYDGIPLTLILDGIVQKSNLKSGGVDERWLLKKLESCGIYKTQQVFFASLDTKGKLFIQEKGEKGRVHMIEALKKEQVKW